MSLDLSFVVEDVRKRDCILHSIVSCNSPLIALECLLELHVLYRMQLIIMWMYQAFGALMMPIWQAKKKVTFGEGWQKLENHRSTLSMERQGSQALRSMVCRGAVLLCHVLCFRDSFNLMEVLWNDESGLTFYWK